MGFHIKQFFLMATLVACIFDSRPINASPVPIPARRAFDTSPAGGNNVNANGARLQDVDATIKEVEGLLNSDPSLPRLTRGEILDIIENLTRTDVQKGLVRDPKAIMVVLPYSADSAQNGDVQSLYTKPPMTHLVEDSDDERITTKPEVPQKKRRPTKKPYQSNYENNQGVKIAKVPTTEASVVSESTKVNDQEEFQQQKQQHNTDVVQKQRTTTENPFTRFINRGRKTTKLPHNHKQEILELAPSTTTTTTTTTEVPRTTRKRKATRKPTTTTTTTTTTIKPFEFMPNQGINIIDPPSFQPMPGKPSVVQFQPIPNRPATTSTTTTPRYIPPRTTTTTSVPEAPIQPMMVDEVQIPEDFKEVLKSLDILIKQSPTEAPATFNDNPVPEQLSEQDKLKLLFASLGVQTTTTTTTSTTSEPDVMQVANNLTPEMKDLLMTFGLIPDPNKDKTTTPKVEIFMEPSSVISPDSYSSFKPLPAGSNSNPNEDMEDFLAKFGLVDKINHKVTTENRKQFQCPSHKTNKTNPIQPNLDVIPDKFKDIIADIGFPIKIDPSKPQSDDQQTEQSRPKEQSTKKPDHVFNPATSGTEYATQDEINRLNQLMGVIKQFEKLNGTASEEDLKHIDLDGLKDLVNSFNVPLDQQEGPNPLDYDVGLLKNEVKRQTSTTEKSTAPINPSLALLEDSFGGNSDSTSEAAAVETTTTEAPKKTGFYYLLDWNSFFDIDNQKGKRVNLRFQPKVGDPKRFFSVNVP
ncbi:LOW QUALITY PROTEIN: mucin-2 [Atheta coriaria]|uniref:LOW QUALITY PROTEIN: mucin-2 n=1 Tax=Dalotia coriaria TaxID=877792 RepID=UPI0031F3890F